MTVSRCVGLYTDFYVRISLHVHRIVTLFFTELDFIGVDGRSSICIKVHLYLLLILVRNL